MSSGVHRFFRRRYAPAWLTLVLGLAVTGWLARGLYVQGEKLDDERFKLEARHGAALLEGTMERYEERLARLADHCALFEELPARVWSFRGSVMTDFDGNMPAVMHALYCPKITATSFQTHFKRGREVWKESYLFDPTKSPGRDVALPVWQFWSRDGFQPIPRGTDMAEETADHPSLRRGLVHQRGGVSSAPARVMRADGTFENGFWFTLALFRTNQTIFASARGESESVKDYERRVHQFYDGAAMGILAVFVSTDRLLDQGFNDPKLAPRLHARLYASREPTPKSLLNPNSPAPVNPRHRAVITQSWYAKRWSLEFTNTPRFEADSARYRSWLVLPAGSGMTLLASALLGVALRAGRRQEEMTEQIREARDALAAAQQEREKFSRDLHDGTIQSLYAIQLGLGHTVQKLEVEPANARRELTAVRAELDTVIAEIRQFITAETGAGQPVDFSAVLHALVQRARTGTTAQIALHCDPGASDRLAGEQAVQLANIAREALSNSLRHAQPQRVEIALRSDRDSVRLEIDDDGVGFDPLAPGRPGVGLTSMASRARELGAPLDIQSSPGKGTRIMIRIPASSPEPTESE